MKYPQGGMPITGAGAYARRMRQWEERLYDLDEGNMPTIAARLQAIEARLEALEKKDDTT